MIWDKYPIFAVLGGILVSISGSTWFGGNGDAEFGKLPKHHLLFSSIGKVIEIPDGSMDRFTDLRQENEITVVLFYAPWCGQSLAAAREFNRTAKILHKQVSFIAINCWVGTCSREQRVDQFPKVVAIHSHFDVVEYKGSFKTSKMIAFLQSVIRPFKYIGTDVELYLAKQSNQEVVISYFNQPMRRNKNYTAFFTLALQFKAKDSSPMFAVVTSAKLALKAGVDSVSGVVYHRLNHAVLSYPSSNSFTSQNLTSWIDANRFQLVVQLTLSLDKRGHFVSHLNKGPALILFLPMKLHLSEESQHILVQYLSTASQYFNCSCIRTTDTRNITSHDLQDIERDNIAKPIKNFDFKEQMSDALQSIITQGDLMITGKEWHLPMLQAHKRKCQSLQIPGQSNLEKKHNVCDVCYTCEHQNCHHDMVPGLQSLITSLSSLRDSCNCFRSGYDLFTAGSICCTVQTVETKNLSSSEQKMPSYLESLRQARTSLDGFLGDLLAAIIPPVSKSALQKGVNEMTSLNVKNSPQKGLSVKDYFDPSPMIFGDETNKNSCTATSTVVQFLGAGCHSNRSVNFFIMDSTEYWHVAEKLGVYNRPSGKTALVIADSENDAQFVLDEKMQITNKSIVGFVMAFMRGNLSRRFRSNSARPWHKCLSSQACIVEVVTSNFRELVLDETKDVLLLYYASWCAFCQSLTPVLLTVAKFFQNITDVTIARINADENDLPWELVVSRYPSLLFFPAYRKDLSIRFPDSLERTVANIVQFVLDHGVKAGTIVQEFRLSAILKEKLDKLEMLLHQVEEEKEIIEMTLRESFGAKELWQKTIDMSSQNGKNYLANQETMRMPGGDLNKVLDQWQHQLKEKTTKLLKGSADVLKQLTTYREKLNCKEKLVSQLMFNNRRFVFNSKQLYVRLWRTVMALQKQKKIVLELQESATAIRRRATQLDISNSIISTKLKNLHAW